MILVVQLRSTCFKDKIETCEYIIHLCSMVNTQFGSCAQRICSGNGTEFTKRKLLNYLLEHGILFESSCVDTPRQIRRVTRKNRHPLNVAMVLRFQASLPIL